MGCKVSGLRLLIRQITAFVPFRNHDLVVPRHACEMQLVALRMKPISSQPRSDRLHLDERKLGQGSSEAHHGLPPKRDVQPVHVVPCLST